MCLKWWLASRRWDELVFARSPCCKEVLLVFYSCASFLASGKHQKSGSSHSWITQKHCVSLWKWLFWKLLFYNSKLPTEKSSLKKQGIFQFVLCYLKTGTFFSEGLIKLWGIIGKSEKSSRLCHLYSQELKRIPKGSDVQDHGKKPYKSLSYKPPGCFILTLMKKLFNTVSKMAFKYSGGRLHCKRTSNFHHLSVTAMETPSGHNSQSNPMSGWQLQYYRHTQ